MARLSIITNTHPLRRTALAGAAALGALLGGCGGDNGHAAFVTRADHVCSVARARARAIPTIPDAASAAAQAAYLRQVVPAARAETSQLQALKVAPGDAAAMRSYVQAQSDQTAAIEQAASALAAGDASGARADFQSALAQTSHIQSLAKRVGLRVCAAEFS